MPAEGAPDPVTIPASAIGRSLDLASRWLALAGGLLLCGVTIMSVTSILGRALLAMPIPGDFELVQIGCGLAVVAFLPLCQLRRGNVIVDFFTTRAGPATRALLDAAGALLYAAIAAVLTWRQLYGAEDLFRYHEISTVLGIPMWLPYLIVIPAFALLTLVALYTAWESLAEMRRSGAGRAGSAP